MNQSASVRFTRRAQLDMSGMATHSTTGQVIEATATLESRMEVSENTQRTAFTAASNAENLAAGCQAGLDDVRKLLGGVAAGVWGRDLGSEGALRGGKPVVELVAEVTNTARQACTEEMLNAVKSLANQVHTGLHMLSLSLSVLSYVHAANLLLL